MIENGSLGMQFIIRFWAVGVISIQNIAYHCPLQRGIDQRSVTIHYTSLREQRMEKAPLNDMVINKDADPNPYCI